MTFEELMNAAPKDELPTTGNVYSSELPKVNSFPPELTDEQSKQISNYFDEALKNYEEILNDQKASEVRNTDRRIESNKQLLEQHKKNLGQSETELRAVKLEYLRRYQALKTAYEQGNIDKKIYQRELNKMAEEYRYKVANLSSDRDFYQGQTKEASDRLKSLEEQQRVNKIILSQEQWNQNINAPKKEERPKTELEKMVQDIRSLQCFEVKDFSKEFK
jgi:hypothetical protein